MHPNINHQPQENADSTGIETRLTWYQRSKRALKQDVEETKRRIYAYYLNSIAIWEDDDITALTSKLIQANEAGQNTVSLLITEIMQNPYVIWDAISIKLLINIAVNNNNEEAKEALVQLAQREVQNNIWYDIFIVQGKPTCLIDYITITIAQGNDETLLMLIKLLMRKYILNQDAYINADTWDIILRSRNDIAILALTQLIQEDNLNLNTVINSANRKLWFYLFFAASKDNQIALNFLQQLIQKTDLNWNEVDKDGNSPLIYLMRAVAEGHQQALNLLPQIFQKTGLDWNLADKNGDTPLVLLMRAAAKGHQQVLDILPQVIKINRWPANAIVVLCEAAQKQHAAAAILVYMLQSFSSFNEYYNTAMLKNYPEHIMQTNIACLEYQYSLIKASVEISELTFDDILKNNPELNFAVENTEEGAQRLLAAGNNLMALPLFNFYLNSGNLKGAQFWQAHISPEHEDYSKTCYKLSFMLLDKVRPHIKNDKQNNLARRTELLAALVPLLKLDDPATAALRSRIGYMYVHGIEYGAFETQQSNEAIESINKKIQADHSISTNAALGFLDYGRKLRKQEKKNVKLIDEIVKFRSMLKP